MTVEMPDHFGGKPIPEDAIEIALAAEKKKKDGNEGGETQGEAPSLDGFVYQVLYVYHTNFFLNGLFLLQNVNQQMGHK